jgi:hypothetical protein
MTDDPGMTAVYSLDLGKSMHVFHDGLTGMAPEREARRFIWLHSLNNALSMLRTAARAHAGLPVPAQRGALPKKPSRRRLILSSLPEAFARWLSSNS